jgi:flagellar protein FliS
MSAKAARAYASNDVEGGVMDSDPAELIVLIFERTLDHLKLGKKMLEESQYGIDNFTKANDLIQKGLLACLDYDRGADVANNLASIYEWSLREIIKGRTEKSPEKIQTVIDVLTPLYEGWLALSTKEPTHFSSVQPAANESLASS